MESRAVCFPKELTERRDKVHKSRVTNPALEGKGAESEPNEGTAFLS